MKDLRFEEFLSKAHNKYGDKFDYSQVDYDKEINYSKFLNDKSLRWRCDWFIRKDDKEYVVEYFGLNDKKLQ